MSESKVSVIDMQAVGLLDGPQYERRRAAQIDRAAARGGRVPPLRTAIWLRLSETNKSLLEQNLAFPERQRIDSLWKRFIPIIRPNCACRVRRGWQEVRSVRCHSRQRCNICAMCSARHCCQRTEDEELEQALQQLRCQALNHTQKTTGQEIYLGRACGVSLLVEDALVWNTSGQARKNGEAKIQAVIESVDERHYFSVPRDLSHASRGE